MSIPTEDDGSPITPRFRFSAERRVAEPSLRHYLAIGSVFSGMVKTGSRVWVHVMGGAVEADVVEIQQDGTPVPEARMGQQVGLLLRGGRTLRHIAAGTGISDSPNYWFTPPPADEPVHQVYAGPEALQWLRQNAGEAPLASNRFRDTAAAIGFVESLYAAGATNVIVNQENIVDEGDGDLYADALVVYLPTEPAAYRRVVAVRSIAKRANPVRRTNGRTLRMCFFGGISLV
jgi:hypothetical protein